MGDQPNTILLIEDDPAAAGMLQKMLTNRRDCCFDVEWVSNLQAGITHLNNNSVDTVLLDLSLSDSPKLESFTTIHTQMPNIPIVILSRVEDETIGLKAVQQGAQDYLIKGQLDDNLLVRIIRHAIERKHIEEELRSSQERFHQVITSISDHIYVTKVTEDIEYINLYVSPHVQSLTGYPQKNFMDDWHFWASKVIHPYDREKAALQAKELAGGKDSEVEYRMIRVGGEVVWVRDSAKVQTEGDSQIIYGVVSDITARKQAEENVRQLYHDLEQRVMDRTQELAALYDVTAVASESLDLETTLVRLLERSLAAMRSNVGAIHTLDETGTVLCLDVQRGLKAEIVEQVTTLPLGNGLPGWIFEQREPLFVPDLSVDSRASNAILAQGLKTYVGVPMRTRGQVLGVLSIFGQAAQQFNVEEVALLASIGDQVGVVIENARLRHQAELAAIMEERERLARELHDSVTQSLYSLTLLAGGGQRLARAGQLDDVEGYLADLGDISQQALKEMRLLVYQLRPTALEQEGLIGALQRRLDAVEKRAGVSTRLLAQETLKLPMFIEEGLYGIVQEALNNAVKHALASSVEVHVCVDNGQVILEVIDDGQGFNLDSAGQNGGIGLISMQERAEKLGGTLKILSKSGIGTTIKVNVEMADS